MTTHGIELCDVGLRAAVCEKEDPRLLTVTDEAGAADWPGFAAFDGVKYAFGQAAEDIWCVHPRRVAHTFWSKLNHEASALAVTPRPPSFSELAYFFLREFTQRLAKSGGAPESIVLAVPGAYLKDEAAEEEKIGLLLGMAHELKLPLAGVIDMGCAALCDPRAVGFNPARPVLLVDLHLHAAELSLFTAEEKLQRRVFLHLPQSGLAELLKHLTATMGNRFLRQTAFDILADGRIEQVFFWQTKTFLTGGAAEHRYHINTSKRAYEMLAKREHLATDAQPFVTALVQAIQRFAEHNSISPALCTLALSDRAAWLPQLETRLRAAGFGRFLRLPAGAAAAGAACIGTARLSAPADLSDVPVEKSVPIADTRHHHATAWEVRLHKTRGGVTRPAPTHAILDGVGHLLSGNGHFTIAAPDHDSDVALPEAFNAGGNCSVPLVRDGGRLWFSEIATAGHSHDPSQRVVIESGDRLTLRCGAASVDVLFAHCRNGHGASA